MVVLRTRGLAHISHKGTLYDNMDAILSLPRHSHAIDRKMRDMGREREDVTIFTLTQTSATSSPQLRAQSVALCRVATLTSKRRLQKTLTFRICSPAVLAGWAARSRPRRDSRDFLVGQQQQQISNIERHRRGTTYGLKFITLRMSMMMDFSSRLTAYSSAMPGCLVAHMASTICTCLRR